MTPDANHRTPGERMAENAVRMAGQLAGDFGGPPPLEGALRTASVACTMLDQEAAEEDAGRVLGYALLALRRARDLAKRAKAPRATEAIRRAISSTEGAQRHADLAEVRERDR